jgi:pimeloyl-ACP methyl ester carboxylesterase
LDGFWTRPAQRLFYRGFVRTRPVLATRVLPELDCSSAGIPGSELVVLPGVGHFASLEAPDAFNAEVRRFLDARC